MGETRVRKRERATAVAAVALALAVTTAGLGAFWVPVASASHGSIHVSSPTGDYFVGQAVNVSGTANESVDSVAVYASAGGDWQLLDVNRNGEPDDEDRLAVDGQGNWSVRNLVLSEASPILSYPGNYRLGVVNAADVGQNGTLPASIAPSRFVDAESGQTLLRINRARLRGSFVTVDGQLSSENAEVTVRGTARGGRELLIVLVDSRGRVATDQFQVPRGNGSFDVDVALRTEEGEPLVEGPVLAHVLALGRDGMVGDGRLPDGRNATLETLAAYLRDLPTNLAPQQVQGRFLAQTVAEAGSDDLLVSEQFDYAEPTTRITTVAPESQFGPRGIYGVTVGDRMVVAGYTNLLPGDNTIRVEAIDGPTPGRLPVVWIHQWNTDGDWSVAMETAGVEPGVYTLIVEAEDETDDQVFVRILPRRGNVTPG